MYKKSVMHLRSCCFAYWTNAFLTFSLPSASLDLKVLNVDRAVANGSNIVVLCFGDHGTKEMLGVAGSKLWPVSNFEQQLPTTCNRVGKRTQHVNPTMLGVVSQQCCVRLHGTSVKHVAKRIVHFDWNISVTIVGSKETKQFCVVLHLCRS